MTQQHPITPPPELVRQWHDEASSDPCGPTNWVAVKAAQWGADQELKECLGWLTDRERFPVGHEAIEKLRAARRPKPPSLKEQALEMLEITRKRDHIDSNAADTTRRALEQLDD